MTTQFVIEQGQAPLVVQAVANMHQQVGLLLSVLYQQLQSQVQQGMAEQEPLVMQQAEEPKRRRKAHDLNGSESVKTAQ